MKEVVLVAAGGATGALARYGAGLLVARLPGKPMPLATLAVNLVGCLIIGMVGQYLSGHSPAGSPALRYGVVIGFLGALTTFSAFGWDSVELLQKAIAQNVAFVPGAPFFANEPQRNTLRLSFVTVPPERIQRGIAVLGALIDSSR